MCIIFSQRSPNCSDTLLISSLHPPNTHTPQAIFHNSGSQLNIQNVSTWKVRWRERDFHLYFVVLLRPCSIVSSKSFTVSSSKQLITQSPVIQEHLHSPLLLPQPSYYKNCSGLSVDCYPGICTRLHIAL